jgi:chemotaxis-related protein WspB
MLFLVFSLGNDRYAIDAVQVVEILPLVNWKSLPGAPPGLAGIIDYRGNPAPLLDLSELALGTPSRKWLSTRIIMINYRDTDAPQLLGLLAEGATGTMQRGEEDFLSPGLTPDGAHCLGPIANTTDGPVQRVVIRHLVPEHIRNLLLVHSSERQNGL